MKKQEKKMVYRRLIRSYLSSIISITLVLFLIGVAGLMAVNAKSISNYFKENIKVSLIFDERVEEKEALSHFRELEEKEYVKSLTLITKEQGEQEMKELLGEDFLEVFESLPIPLSIDLFLKADYIETESIEGIKEELLARSGSREVLYQESLVKSINENMEKAGYVALILTVILLFISIVLINNTVRLNLYSKRFTIHTMKLVGAKRSFIRRPLLVAGAIQGALSALLSLSLLALLIYFVMRDLPQFYQILDRDMIHALLATLIPLGVLLTVITTLFISNRLISLTGDSIY